MPVPAAPTRVGDGGLPSPPPRRPLRKCRVSTPDHQFDRFTRQAADGHTRIPVVRAVFSDLDPPLAVYLKLLDGPHPYLFESVEGGERYGRFSINGLPAPRVYAFAQGRQ